jgi:Zn-dependent protease
VLPEATFDAARGAAADTEAGSDADPVPAAPDTVLLRPAPPDEDLLFQSCQHLVRSPEPQTGPGGWWLIVSLLAFVFARPAKQAPLELAILIGVLLFHEFGHWLGMQVFGYRNVKMFFIPFFGAAVTGKKEGVPQWQEAVVLLLGPLPGIVLGCALYFWNLADPQPVMARIAGWLVGLNAFNLLPLEPLDGGRFLNLVIFSRHRVLEALFLAVTSLLVIGLGWWLRWWVFTGLGVLGLLLAPPRYRIARAAARVRGRWGSLPPRVADAAEPLLRDVFSESRAMVGHTANHDPAPYARTMRTIYERAAAQPVSAIGSLGLLTCYGGGIALFWVWVVATLLVRMGR